MIGRRLKILTGIVMSIILLASVIPVSAKTKGNNYAHRVVSIANKGYTNTQAFTVGSRYAYYIQRYNKGDGNHYKLYRSDVEGKNKAPVEIKAIKPSDARAFGHANDMVTFSPKGSKNTHLLVTTYEEKNKKANQDLTNIEIYKDKKGKLTYKAVGHYKLKLKGNVVGVGGIDKLKSEGTKYTFMVKRAMKIYKVVIDVSKPKGKGNLKYEGTLVFGKYKKYVRQGIEYSGGKLYVPLWAGESNMNKSAILRFDWNKVSKKKNTPYEKSYLEKRPKGEKFEIENCSVLQKRLYYATNGVTRSGNQFDEIGYFGL